MMPLRLSSSYLTPCDDDGLAYGGMRHSQRRCPLHGVKSGMTHQARSGRIWVGLGMMSVTHARLFPTRSHFKCIFSNKKWPKHTIKRIARSEDDSTPRK